jgi:hypothetical protein
MLDTTKSFLLSGRDQLAVAHQRRGGIAMKSVQAKNKHEIPSMRSDVYDVNKKYGNVSTLHASHRSGP